MKAIIDGVEYEMTVAEFKEITRAQEKPSEQTPKAFYESAVEKTLNNYPPMGKFNRYQQWTSEDTLKLITAHKQGLPLSKIAKYLGRTTQSLQSRLWLLQHDKVPGISYTTKGQKHLTKVKWTEQERAALARMVAQETSLIEMAKRLGRTTGSVSGQMSQMGLYR